MYKTPRDWVVEGTWPDGVFAADAPDAVAHAVAIAKALDAALTQRTKSRVAHDAAIERSTLYDILSGKSWPDTVTLANLERELGTTLWPPHPAPAVRRDPAPSP